MDELAHGIKQVEGHLIFDAHGDWRVIGNFAHSAGLLELLHQATTGAVPSKQRSQPWTHGTRDGIPVSTDPLASQLHRIRCLDSFSP